MMQNVGEFGGHSAIPEQIVPSAEGSGDARGPRIDLGRVRETPKPSPEVWTKVR